jgi:NAD(P)-dependent dehydrogenase (short-subunit alcohol dehydrogenase family)
MKNKMEGRVAIVTGGGSGIGQSTAILMAGNGIKVIVADVDSEGGKATVDKIHKKGGEAAFIKADTSKPKDSERTVKMAIKKFGGLHIAVNNAGVGGAMATIADYPIESWDKTIAINLSGVFYGMHYQIPAIISSGGGAIVNMASILGQVGSANSSAYVAAKHGVVGLTKNAGLEFAKEGVRVNAVGPGYIKTPLLTSNLSAKQMKDVAKLHPIGRLGRSEEVAELVLWLCSDKASFITGSYYPIDGGYLAQ